MGGVCIFIFIVTYTCAKTLSVVGGGGGVLSIISVESRDQENELASGQDNRIQHNIAVRNSIILSNNATQIYDCLY